jgi:hypothetical protein
MADFNNWRYFRFSDTLATFKSSLASYLGMGSFLNVEVKKSFGAGLCIF